MTKKTKIKINSAALAQVNGLEQGAELELPERAGVVLDPYWRARINDARFDNCVEVVNITKKPTKKSEKNDDS